MAVEITEEFVWQNIPRRPRDSHKGTFGSVLAVAGSAFYRGAALLAAEGALRTGAGIVTLASVEPVVSAAAARLPECCLCPCRAGAEGGISPENVPLLRRQIPEPEAGRQPEQPCPGQTEAETGQPHRSAGTAGDPGRWSADPRLYHELAVKE